MPAENDDYISNQYLADLRTQYYITPFSLVRSNHVTISNRTLLPLGSTGQCHVVTAPNNPPPPKPNSINPNLPGMPTVLVWSSLELVQALLAGTPTILIARDIDISDSVPLPEVTSKVTIIGNCKGGEPCILDAGGIANHFTVGLSGYLTLKDIELRNGYCTHGGAVLVTGIGTNQFGLGGKFVALHVHFYNNTATEAGGAVAVETGGLAWFHSSLFFLNTAPLGGAVYIGSADSYPMALTREMEAIPVIHPLGEPGPTSGPSSASEQRYNALAPSGSPPMMINPRTLDPVSQPAEPAIAPAPIPYYEDTAAVPSPGAVSPPSPEIPEPRESKTTAPAPAPMEDTMPGCSLSSCATAVDNIFLLNVANKGGAIYVDDIAPSCGEDGSGGAKIEITNTRFENNSALESGGAVFLGWRTAGAVGHIKSSDFINNTAMDGGGDITLDKATYNDTRGVELFAYNTQFSGMVVGTDGQPIHQPVDVEALGNATFSHCEFPDTINPVICKQSSCSFCQSVFSSLEPILGSGPAMEPMPPVEYVPMPKSERTSSERIPKPLSSPYQLSIEHGKIVKQAFDSLKYKRAACPVLQSGLCGWTPPECQASPPPPPSPPPPSPPPPSPPPPSPPPPSPPPPSPPPPSPPPPSPPPPKRSPPPPSPPPPSPPPPSPPPPSPPPPSPSPPPPSPPPPSPPPPSPPPPPPVRPCVNGVCPACPSCHHRRPHGTIKGDPHFVGKHGEHFDFQGRSGRDYCVLSDKDVHVNMHVFPGIKRGTTFISEIGFLYRNTEIYIDAHAHANASSLSKQWSMLVNNVDVERNQHVTTADGLTIHRSASGARIMAPGVLDVNVTIVPPSYGPRGSGANSINFKVDKMKVTPSVHGVLGQTYQETKMTYKKLHDASKKHGHRAAEVLVDGTMEDYLTSNILAPDCKYTQFEGRTNLVKRIHRLLMSKAGVMFTSDSAQEEITDICTGFGQELDCKKDDSDHEHY
ncbi:hypothetical protein R1sor_010739 [Riccia sorocarpa]|uniref:Uncharacterized protein n=1 Tax=Riccia sorocarpa TaxID=122646 RepID=A0ABD3HYY1_9MARC